MSRNSSAATLGLKLYSGDFGAAANLITDRIANLRKFPKLPSGKTIKFETTDIDQDDGGGNPDPWMTFNPGNIDPGEFSIVIGNDEDELDTLHDLHANQTKKGFKILKSAASGGRGMRFDGFVLSIEPAADEGKEILHTVTFACSGPITRI